MSSYSLIILKNPDLLQSIRDYFYESLLQYDFDSTITSEEHKIDSVLNEITTSYAVIIQEGMFFFDNFEPPEQDGYDLIGHILDRKEEYYQVHQQHFILNVDKWKEIKSPSFKKQDSNQLTSVERSVDNFHDAYTPTWIKSSNSTVSNINKLRFGGYVISEFLKHNLKIRPFNTNERQVKHFVYYDEVEQVNSIVSYKQLSPVSYYFPLQTSTKSKVFVTKFSNYLSVANGIDSMKRIKDVYKSIKTITYYDTSIISLIFTELLIKNYKGNYKDFVQEFDNVYGAIEFNRSFDRKAYHKLDSYTDPEEIKPILEYIRNNVEVKFCIGDITRTSILEQLTENTIISLTNAFQFKYNLIRETEQHFWFDKIKELNVKIDVLH